LSPEARTMATVLARLLAEIKEDRHGIAKRISDAREAQRRLDAAPDDPGTLALAGYALHGWYTGFETVCERIARELDLSVPTGERWHRELLSQMSADVPGVRPAVIDSRLVSELALLLAFRHFFRHAYAVTLEADRLTRELSRLLAVEAAVGAALDTFAAFLTATMLSASS
jgi:hypothetical protein